MVYIHVYVYTRYAHADIHMYSNFPSSPPPPPFFFRYVANVYSLEYLRQQQHVTADQALAMGVVCNLCGALVAPFSGVLCDSVGVGKMFLAGQVCRMITRVVGVCIYICICMQ